MINDGVAEGSAGKPGRSESTEARLPRLLVAVTDSISSVLLRGQLRYARSAGFEVTLLCSPGEEAVELARAEGAGLIQIPMSREISPGSDLVSLLGIIRALLKLKPDVINASTPKAGLLVTLAASLCGIRHRIYTLRGLRLETASGLTYRMLYAAERTACRLATRILCISGSLRERAVSLNLFEPGKAIVLGKGSSNGIDLERFNPSAEARERARRLRQELEIPEEAKVLGFVGRLVRQKGSVELCEAWSRLSGEYPSLHLLIVGEFEAGDAVPDEVVKALRSDPRIHITGWVSDTAPYYLLMDLLVLPSYREGFGNVLLEAAAMEVATIASDIPGCRDALADGETGTLIPSQDAPALTAAIRDYLDDDEKRLRHGLAGRERACRFFRPEVIWEGQCAEYRRLLGLTGVVQEGR